MSVGMNPFQALSSIPIISRTGGVTSGGIGGCAPAGGGYSQFGTSVIPPSAGGNWCIYPYNAGGGLAATASKPIAGNSTSLCPQSYLYMSGAGGGTNSVNSKAGNSYYGAGGAGCCGVAPSSGNGIVNGMKGGDGVVQVFYT
jgi:hypothetical protein